MTNGKVETEHKAQLMFPRRSSLPFPPLPPAISPPPDIWPPHTSPSPSPRFRTQLTPSAPSVPSHMLSPVHHARETFRLLPQSPVRPASHIPPAPMHL